jgi:hypothetical protein
VLGIAYVAVFPALLAYHFWALGVAAVGAPRAGSCISRRPSGRCSPSPSTTFGLHHAVGSADPRGRYHRDAKWAG